ncbi:hypothetical protein QTP88_022260 [Uroleucon formosanum]
MKETSEEDNIYGLFFLNRIICFHIRSMENVDQFYMTGNFKEALALQSDSKIMFPSNIFFNYTTRDTYPMTYLQQYYNLNFRSSSSTIIEIITLNSSCYKTMLSTLE